MGLLVVGQVQKDGTGTLRIQHTVRYLISQYVYEKHALSLGRSHIAGGALQVMWIWKDFFDVQIIRFFQILFRI